MRSLSGRLARTTAILGLTVAAFGSTAVSPAMADSSGTAGCTRAFTFRGSEVQVDNCSSGWVWAWGGNTDNWTTVYVTDNFNHKGELRTWRNQAQQRSFTVVKSFHMCVGGTVGWAPPIPYHFCTEEVTL
ncbi:hypothetical protein ABT354_12655 [Streptomyces sp. NPDC000594]|uniref:hypothetical protein n=1 Tax=Streptomyces sp. NPDC000594 TaxID=3154261 RepID=UPI003318B5B1